MCMLLNILIQVGLMVERQFILYIFYQILKVLENRLIKSTTTAQGCQDLSFFFLQHHVDP